MKKPIEWLNDVADAVMQSMTSGRMPPGVEVEEIIIKIQDNAVLDMKIQKDVAVAQLAKVEKLYEKLRQRSEGKG